MFNIPHETLQNIFWVFVLMKCVAGHGDLHTC